MGEADIEAMRRGRMAEALERSFAALPGGSRSLSAFEGGRILASGATGFFGVWIHAAVERLNQGGARVELARLSRSPEAFDAAHPRWAKAPWASWIKAGAGGFAAAKPGEFGFALHMAGSSDAAANAADPGAAIEVAIQGCKGMLDLCEAAGARMLMCGSGAVYGRRSMAQGPSKESDAARSAPDPLDARQCYGEAKRAAEAMCAARAGRVDWTVARPFAFMGPWLPLSAHFAAGNFLRDAAMGRAVEIKGDGRPARSYMHPADLAAWLLWLAIHGPSGEAVNVGSGERVELGELAAMAAAMAGSPPPKVLGELSADPDCYLPDVGKARGMGLGLAHGLSESLADSLAWLAASGASRW